MTVLVLERHLVDPARRDRYDSAVRGLVQAMRTAPGSLWADAARSEDDPELVTVVSEWRAGEDADAFLAGPEYESFLTSVDVSLREDVSTRRFSSD